MRDAIESSADGVVHSFFNSVADDGYGEMFVSHRALLSPTFAGEYVRSSGQRRALSRDSGIAPGFRADLLLVNGDPTSDIVSTRDIAMVWLACVPVDRNKLLEKIKYLEQITTTK